MTTDKRNQPSPRLATSRADELIYAITLAMARRQMRRNWGYQFPSWDEVAGALRSSNAVRARAAL